MQILWESLDKKRIVTYFHGKRFGEEIYLVMCEKLIEDIEWGYDNLANEKLVTISELIELETGSSHGT
jgi:hypothetical protein